MRGNLEGEIYPQIFKSGKTGQKLVNRQKISFLQNNSSKVNNYAKEMQIRESFKNIVKFYGNLHFHNYLQKSKIEL